MIKIFLAFLISFALSCVFAPFVIKLTKKVGARQEILHYVDAHKKKQGTPTMGGLIFVLPAIFISFLLFDGQAESAIICLGVLFSYALLGFLDDFIKVHTHKNLGLKAYQKVIGQVGIALIIGFYMYFYSMNRGILYLPMGIELDIGWWIIPFTIFVFLAMTNSTNLTDGLDGLAGWTSFVMILGFVAIIGISTFNINLNGGAGNVIQEYNNLMLVGAAVLGGLLAFLIFNSYPAKIFMGDTGSLALGGVITCLGVFSGWTLLLPFICFVFVLSVISVILQVLHYKRTKKRIFLMAPLHHHFEKKGVNETKIVAIYIIITICVTSLSILLCLC